MADRIPEGWRECKLGEVAEINRNSIDNEYSQNKILYLDTSSITRGKVDCYQELLLSDAPSRAKRLVKDKDIIYSTVRPIQRHYGIIKNPPPNLVVSTGFIVIETNQKEADSFFIYYFLTSHEIVEYLDIIAEASTSAYPSLRPADIESLEILLPPLPEQRTIASVLSSLDDKIDLLNRENHTLEQMAEALFRQWFIEEADEKWEEGTIANMIDILPGFPFKSDLFTELGKYCLITIKSVQDGHLDISKTDKINDIPSRMPNYCYLKPGDILLSLTGNVGRCCLVDVNNALLNQRVAKLFAKNSRDMAYTYIYFRMEKTKRLLEEMAKGTAQPNLSPVETLRIKMRIPPKSKLELFSSKSNPIIKRILCNKMQIRTLEKLRDTLLPKLMSREVRVKL